MTVPSFCCEAAVSFPHYAEGKRRPLGSERSSIALEYFDFYFFLISLAEISHQFVEITTVPQWNSAFLGVCPSGQAEAK